MSPAQTLFANYLEQQYDRGVADRYQALVESPSYTSSKGGRSNNYYKPLKGKPRKTRRIK